MANTVIQLKKSSTPGSSPSTGNLANGELAINFADGVIYYKNLVGQVAQFTAPGKNYGTVNANGTLLVSGIAGDVFTILPGQNITVVGDAVNDRVTIGADLTSANAASSANDASQGANIAVLAASFVSNSQSLSANVNTLAATFASANANNISLSANVNVLAANVNTLAAAALANTSGVSFNGNLYFPTGNVGIGTSNPQAALDVYNASRFALRLTGPVSNGPIFDFYRQNTRTAFIETDSSNNFLLAVVQQGPSLSLRTNGGSGPVDRLVINTDGNVGIGTSTANAKLDIGGDATNKIRLSSSSDSTNFYSEFINYYNSGKAFEITHGGVSFLRTAQQGYYNVEFGPAQYHWRTNYGDGYISANTNSVERLRITSSGRVGIGNTAPDALLQVAGTTILGGDTVGTMDVKFSRLLSGTRVINHWFSHSANSPWYLFGQNMTWNGERTGTVDPTHSYRPYYEAYAPVVGYKEFGFANVSSGSIASSNLVPNMVLTNTGNVGMGSLAPAEKLHVVGNILLPQSTANTGAILGVASSDNFTTSGVIMPHYGMKWASPNDSVGPTGFLSAYYGLRFFVGGSEAVRIDANTRNVGIGTTNPGSYKLNVSGSDPVAIFNSSSTSPFIALASSGTRSAYIQSDTSTGMLFVNERNTPAVFYTNNTERMRIDANGNVAIGQASAPERLTVFRDTDNSAEVGRAHIGYVGYNDYAGFSHVDMNGAGNYALLHSSVGDTFLNSATGQPIYFRHGNSDQMILSAGKLGIGTTSPTGRLDVWGVGTGRAIQTNPNDLGYAFTTFNASAGNAEQFNIKHNLAAVELRNERGQLNLVTNTANPIVFYTANTAERMRIASDGNVGIGTTTPTATLHVQGNANIALPNLVVGGTNVIAAIVASNANAVTLSSNVNTLAAAFVSNSQSLSANVNTLAATFASANANSISLSSNVNVLAANVNTLAGAAYPKTGGTISGDVTVTGSLTVSGATTYVNTQTLLIGDNLVTLNADLPGNVQPTENAGLEINRGARTSNAAFIWNENANSWQFTSNTLAGVYSIIASQTDANNVGVAANNFAAATYLTQSAFNSANANAVSLSANVNFLAAAFISNTQTLSANVNVLAATFASANANAVSLSANVNVLAAAVVANDASQGANIATLAASFVSNSQTLAAYATTVGASANSYAAATYVTSSGNISGYSGSIFYSDNRQISPSEDANNRLKFGFTSWNNDSAGPYADYLHTRSYGDATGGNDNLIVFRKDQIGMRIWQQTFSNTSPYATYKDVAFTTDVSGVFNVLNVAYSAANTNAASLSANVNTLAATFVSANANSVSLSANVNVLAAAVVANDASQGANIAVLAASFVSNSQSLSANVNTLAATFVSANANNISLSTNVNILAANVNTLAGSLGLANTSGVSFNGNLFFPTGNVGIGAATTTFNSVPYKLYVNGSFAATTKSFVIDHPTNPDMKLRYGSLEGPENGVYVRGRLDGIKVIELPDYWEGLVDLNTITVQLTAIGHAQNLYVAAIDGLKIHIDNENHTQPYCYYSVYGERKDVEKLIVEY